MDKNMDQNSTVHWMQWNFDANAKEFRRISCFCFAREIAPSVKTDSYDDFNDRCKQSTLLLKRCQNCVQEGGLSRNDHLKICIFEPLKDQFNPGKKTFATN